MFCDISFVDCRATFYKEVCVLKRAVIAVGLRRVSLQIIIVGSNCICGVYGMLIAPNCTQQDLKLSTEAGINLATPQRFSFGHDLAIYGLIQAYCKQVFPLLDSPIGLLTSLHTARSTKKELLIIPPHDTVLGSRQ